MSVHPVRIRGGFSTPRRVSGGHNNSRDTCPLQHLIELRQVRSEDVSDHLEMRLE